MNGLNVILRVMTVFLFAFACGCDTAEGRTPETQTSDTETPEGLKSIDPKAFGRSKEIKSQQDDPAVAKEIERLKSDDAKVQCRAALMLRIMGPRAKGAVGALTEALGDESYRVRFTAAQALRSIGPPAAGATVALAAALKDKKDSVRWNAAAALARIGPGAGKAGGALTEALKDDNIQVRRYSADALAAIGKPTREAVGALAAMLKDKEISACLSAAEALAKLGEGKRAVDTLAAALKHDDLYSRRRAAEILEIIGPDARGAAPALLHAVNDADGWLTPKVAARAAGARALGVSEKVLRDEAIPFQNDNWIVRWRAARALGKIDPQIATDKVVPVLIKMLNHEQSWVRGMSVETLGAIGRPARAAIPALKVILANDKIESVWRGAHKALELIGAGKPKAIPFQPVAAKSIAYVGGLSVTIYLVADDAVLRLMIPLGKTRIKGNSVVSVASGKGQASLFRGKDAWRSILPRGAAPPPDPSIKREPAVSGKFTCIDIPAQKTWPYHGKTRITVKDMQLMFPSGRVTAAGPLTFILRPFPAAAVPANGAAAVGANKAAAKGIRGFKKIDAFVRGDARIAPGLTRAEIRKQLSKGKVKSHKPYAFIKPQPEMFKRDIWVISYGPEVPGMGRVDVLRVSFKDGKVSKLEHKVYLCP